MQNPGGNTHLLLDPKSYDDRGRKIRPARHAAMKGNDFTMCAIRKDSLTLVKGLVTREAAWNVVDCKRCCLALWRLLPDEYKRVAFVIPGTTPASNTGVNL